MLLASFLKGCLLDQDDYMLPSKTTEEAILNYEQSMIDESNNFDYKGMSKKFALLKFLFDKAWERGDDILPFYILSISSLLFCFSHFTELFGNKSLCPNAAVFSQNGFHIFFGFVSVIIIANNDVRVSKIIIRDNMPGLFHRITSLL